MRLILLAISFVAILSGSVSAQSLSVSIENIDGSINVVVNNSVSLYAIVEPDGNYTYSLSGSPTNHGLSFDDENAGDISGTPTATGTFTITVTVEEVLGSNTASTSFTMNVTAAADKKPTFGSKSVGAKLWTQNTVITAFTLPTATSGDGTLSYTLAPNLPTGVTKNASHQVSGTPSISKTLTTYTWTATDSDGDTATLKFTITVNADTAPVFSGSVSNQIYKQNNRITNLTLPVASGGNDTISYTLSPSSLPAGLNLSGRVISGTPTEVFSTQTYTWKATDSDSDSDTRTFTITVESVPTITFSESSPFKISLGDEIEEITVDVRGGSPPYDAFSIFGLPNGMTKEDEENDADGGDAILKGTPTAAGSFTVTVSVRDDGIEKTKSLVIQVIKKPALSISSPSVTEGNSGSATLRFTVSLSAASGQQVTVAYKDAGTGTATSGTDYTAITSGTLTFTAGQTSKNIDVSVIGDTLDEPNETVVVKLSSPSNATIATSTGTGTITDDDDAPSLSINSPSETEGDSGSKPLRFTVSLSAASGKKVTVTYTDAGTGTATSGTDYRAITSSTLTFTAGQTSKNIDVSVIGDTIDEPDETVVVKLSSPSNATIATSTGTGTITDDDDAPSLSIDSPSVNEGNSGSTTLRFTVSLSAASGKQVTVKYADDGTGTATSGTDYTAITSSTLTFAAGQTSRNIDVSVIGDTIDEPDETVVVKLSSPSNATIATSTGTGTITDDDDAPSLSINSPSVTEGDSGSKTLRFTVSLSAASGKQVTVNYADGGGTATSGTDYRAITSSTLTFTAGQTSKNIDVSVIGDTIDEPDETVVVKLSSPSNATIATSTGTGTITDDDDAPSLSINSPSVTEGDSGSKTLRFTVSLSAASGKQVTVNYADTETGTATSGTDYTAIPSGTLTFTAGQTSKNIDVSVIGDTLDEPNETVVVELSSPSNATIATGTGTGTITDDDDAPSLSINSPSVTEGDSGSKPLRFTVSLSAASGKQVTVNYADTETGTATSGTDYTAIPSGTLTFTAGQTSKNIDVSVIGDTLDEPNETVVVELSSPSNATTATSTGTGTIRDDDDAPSLSINSPSVTEGDSGSKPLRFTVSLSVASGKQVTVNYADAGTGTATSETDYRAITSGTLTFTAGQTSKNIDVSVIGDTLDEPDETVIIKLSSPSNATIATGTGTGTIIDPGSEPSLSINSPSVNEGNSGSKTLRFTVSLGTASGKQVTVKYADAGSGTATSGTDYAAITAGTLTFAAGETSKSIDVSVIGDTIDEPNETVIVELSNPSNATIATSTGTGTIRDDDDAPSLSINSPSVTEGATGTTDTLRFAVSLSAASGKQVTVTYADGGGTATSGTDYTAITSSTLTFTAGQTSRTIDVSVIGDTIDESDETVVVKLSSPSNATIATSTGTGTITDDDDAPSLSINSPSVTEGDSGSKPLRFTVSLSVASGKQVTVNYADAGTGTATSETDYRAITSGTLTFTAGQTSKNIDVSVIGDTLDEPDETVIIKLSSPSNATIATGTGTGTIIDPGSEPSLSINSPSVNEGNSGSKTLRFTVSLGTASGKQVTVKYADAGSGTATSGTDYAAITAGTLTFTAGETSKTIDVSVIGDTLDEPNETVKVKLSNARNATIATSTGTGTIRDDDEAPTLSISSPSVTEGATGTTDTLRFAVSLSAASGKQVTVTYADGGGTATSGTDYTAITSGTLTFTTGETRDTLKVAVIGDAINEPNETVIVQLSNPSNATIATGTGTGTITDDDGTPSLSISSPSVTEGATGTTDTLRFAVSLSAASGQQVTVNYAEIATGRTATPGTDYTALSAGTLTFAAGETRDTLKVAVIGDAINEPNETVIVELSNARNATIATGTGTGTITDDDGTPSLSISSPSVTEGATGTTDTLRFAVSLSAASGKQVTVTYADGGGTATSGTDYTAITSGTLTFTAGETHDTLKVAVIGDAINEPNETVIVQLSNPSNATIATGTGTGTITDDDGTPSLSISSPSVTEGATGTTDTLRFAVSLSAASGQQVTVNYAEIATGRTATPGTDYMALSAGTLTFAAGEMRDTLKVAVIGDAINEPNETVIVELSNARNATIATGTGTGTITDDDGTPSLSISSPSVTEGATGTTDTLRFAVSLSAASGQQVTVAYADAGTGTATSGTDYTAITSGTLTFAAGETSDTLKVAVIGDTLDEPNETVIVQLSNPSNATIATGTGTGTITDDDIAVDAITISFETGVVSDSVKISLGQAIPEEITVDVSGGSPPYESLSIDGLPEGTCESNINNVGLCVSTDKDEGDATISGTPTEPGIFTITVTVQDTAVQDVSKSFIFDILGVLPIAPKVFLINEAIDTIYVSQKGGKPPYTYFMSGAPSGITIDANSGRIDGTPSQEGTFPVTVRVTDTDDRKASHNFSMLVYSKALAEKFSPILILTEHPRKNRIVLFPEPVEIMGAESVSNLWFQIKGEGRTINNQYPASGWSPDVISDYQGRSSLVNFLKNKFAFLPETFTYVGSRSGIISGIYEVTVHFEYPGDDKTSWNSTYIGSGSKSGDNFDNTAYVNVFDKYDDDQFVIQYYYFYPFNDYQNNHEGDWQHITVIVSSIDATTAKLTGINYRFHGQGLTYNEIAATRIFNPQEHFAPAEGGTHPVVYVGAGSHGGYPTGGNYTNPGGARFRFEKYLADEFLVEDESMTTHGIVLSTNIENTNREVAQSYVLKHLPNPDRGQPNMGLPPEMSWLGTGARWGTLDVSSPFDIHDESPLGPFRNGSWRTWGTKDYGSDNVSYTQFQQFPIVQDVTWRGTIYLIGDIVVYPGATLTIEDGTTIRAYPNRDIHVWHDTERVDIVNYGTIVANGSVEQRIVFNSQQPSNPKPNDWYGITNHGSLTMRNVIIRDAVDSVRTKGTGTQTLANVQYFNMGTGGSTSSSSSLRLSSAMRGNREAVLEWWPSNNPTIARYQYRQRAGISGTWLSWTDLTQTGTAPYHHHVTGLTNGMEYLFQVRGVDSEGNSEVEISASRTATPAAVPAKVGSLVAAAGNAQVTLTWTNPQDTTITKYQYDIRRDSTWSGMTDIPGSDSTTTSYIVTGLRDSLYGFAVRAVNSTGAGPRTRPVSATPLFPPSPPVGVGIGVGNGKARIGWLPGSDNGTPIQKYQYRQRTAAGTWAESEWKDVNLQLFRPPGVGYIYLITGLTNNTLYYFQVRAVSSVGASAPSDSTWGTPRAVPERVMNVVAAAGNGQVTLTWSAANDTTITKYQYRYKQGANAWSSAIDIPGSSAATNRYTVTGLTNNTRYGFVLYAVNDIGESWLPSKVVYATPTVAAGKPALELDLPDTFSVAQNYPNPFNPETIIAYELPESEHVKLVIYNVLGQEIRTLVNDLKPPGRYVAVWDSRDELGHRVSSGIYLYRIVAGDFVQIKKMLILK